MVKEVGLVSVVRNRREFLEVADLLRGKRALTSVIHE